MKLGVSTSCYYPLETELALKEIANSGIKIGEIFFNAQCELKPSFIDILKDIKNSYEINIPGIHPTLSLAESFNFFSNYERRFNEYLYVYEKYSEIAATLGGKYIIMHGGKPNGLLEDEEYCQRYMLIKERCLKNGITVLQENVARHRTGDIEFLRSMKNILGNDAEFCLDIKQSVRCGLMPTQLVEEFHQNIKHYHISDHSIASDCQLPLNGGFDFKSFFKLVHSKGYTGNFIIEVYNNAYKNYSEIIKSYENLMLNIF